MQVYTKPNPAEKVDIFLKHDDRMDYVISIGRNCRYSSSSFRKEEIEQRAWGGTISTSTMEKILDNQKINC